MSVQVHHHVLKVNTCMTSIFLPTPKIIGMYVENLD